MDHIAHRRAEQGGYREDEDEGEIGIDAVLLDGDRKKHAREGDDRADRQVDAA